MLNELKMKQYKFELVGYAESEFDFEEKVLIAPVANRKTKIGYNR